MESYYHTIMTWEFSPYRSIVTLLLSDLIRCSRTSGKSNDRDINTQRTDFCVTLHGM